MSAPGLDAELERTITEIRDYAHALGAVRLRATMPTLDGEAIIDYRPGDWLKVRLVDGESQDRVYVLPPDWGRS